MSGGHRWEGGEDGAQAPLRRPGWAPSDRQVCVWGACDPELLRDHDL